MSYPINELYAWIVDDPTGEHGIVAWAPAGDHRVMQAATSKRAVAEKMRLSLTELAPSLGHAIKLQRFVLAETIETVGQ